MVHRPSVARTLFIIAAFQFLFACVITVFLVAVIRNENDGRVQARMVVCQRTERLAKARRLDAWRTWNTLPVTLKLLHIQNTKKTRDLARENLYRSLHRFAPIDCKTFAESGKVKIIPAPKDESREGFPPGRKKDENAP